MKRWLQRLFPTRHIGRHRRNRPLAATEPLEARVLPAVYSIALSPETPGANLSGSPYIADHGSGLSALNLNTPVESPAQGRSIGEGLTYDDATNRLTFRFGYGSAVNLPDLKGKFDRAELHGPGTVKAPESPNTDGPAIRSLAASHQAQGPHAGTFIGSLTLNSVEERLLFENQLYVDIHSDAFPTGELRSQLVPQQLDYGDAPDAADGTFPGDYRTRLADGGPVHALDNRLTLGRRADHENDAVPSPRASGDNTRGLRDEDGLAYAPYSRAVIGTAPEFIVSARNLTDNEAILHAFFDANRDGDFEDAGEQTFVKISAQTDLSNYEVRFDKLPLEAAPGPTILRLRLSTAAQLGATGFAADGEVEDHLVELRRAGSLEAAESVPAADWMLGRSHGFLINLGDIDGNGIPDIASGRSRGLDIHLLDASGETLQTTSLTVGSGPLAAIPSTLNLGKGAASVGDINGDGIPDLVVGAPFGGGDQEGSAYVLMMGPDGNPLEVVEWASDQNGIPQLSRFNHFGWTIAHVGDLDDDGIPDVAVGAPGDEAAFQSAGAVHILFLHADGTVRESTSLRPLENGLDLHSSELQFQIGRLLASPGDIDGDGYADLVAGGTSRFFSGAALNVLFLDETGAVRDVRRISPGFSSMPDLDLASFHMNATRAGDLNLDGIPDILLGAPEYPFFLNGESREGAVLPIFFSRTGSVEDYRILTPGSGAVPDPGSDERFAATLLSDIDLNGDGTNDLIEGSFGGVHITTGLYIDTGDAPDPASGTGPGNYQTRPEDDGPLHYLDIDGSRDVLFGYRVDENSVAAAQLSVHGDNGESARPNDEDGLRSGLIHAFSTGNRINVHIEAVSNTDEPWHVYGWLDISRDGIFDNTTERYHTQPIGRGLRRLTLTFDAPEGFVSGPVNLRMRIGTDARIANPTGPAIGGEVEDHVLYLQQATAPSAGIEAVLTNPRPAAQRELDRFGESLTIVGDLDGNGAQDFAVGLPNAESSAGTTGAVMLFLMENHRTVRETRLIGHDDAGLLQLHAGARFGAAVTMIPDVNADGRPDLAVGAPGFDAENGGVATGEVFLISLADDAETIQRIAALSRLRSQSPSPGEEFGAALAVMASDERTSAAPGYFNLLVGAPGTNHGELQQTGAVHFYRILGHEEVFMATHSPEINGIPPLPPFARLGQSIAPTGNMIADRHELAYGLSRYAAGDVATLDDSGAVLVGLVPTFGGAVLRDYHVLTKFSPEAPPLHARDQFGKTLLAAGDLNGDGRNDLLVGAPGSDAAGLNAGQIYSVILPEPGEFAVFSMILKEEDTSPLLPEDRAGSALALVRSAHDDGIPQLLVGIPGRDAPQNDSGAVLSFRLSQSAPLRPRVFGPERSQAPAPQLTISGATNADEYEIWIKNQSEDINPFFTDTSLTRSYTIGRELGIGMYNIWVRGRNEVGYSEWSTQLNLQVNTPPALHSPIRRQRTPRPTVQWEPLAGAHSYEVWINRLGFDESPYFHIEGLEATSLNFTEDLPLGRYRAWVRGASADGLHSLWSTPVEFHVVTPPTVTHGDLPTFDSTPYFQWTGIPGAARYEVFLRNRNTGETVLHETNLPSPQFEVPFELPEGPYRWWAIAVGEDGTRGDWTHPTDLFVGGRTDLTLTDAGPASLRWLEVVGAVRYELWVDRINGQQRVIHETSLTDTEYRVEPELRSGEYRAWVRAVNSEGESSPWSLLFHFDLA